MIDRDFEALRLVATDSRIWRGAAGAASGAQAAWNDSRTASLVRGLKASVEALRPAARVRAGALVAAWMGAGHLVFLWLAPPYVAPGLPRVWVVAGILAALGVAAFADSLTNAWAGSTVARAVRMRT